MEQEKEYSNEDRIT